MFFLKNMSFSTPHSPLKSFWNPNSSKKFQFTCTSCLCLLKKKSNLRCAIPVSVTSKNKYFMPKSKVHAFLPTSITYYVQTLNTSDLDTRLIFKILHIAKCTLNHLLISDIQHVKLRHMHHIPLTTEQNLSKKLT